MIGIKRRASTFNTKRIDHVYDNPKFKKSFDVVYGDLTDSSNITRIIQKYKPDEIYNLGAQSHVLTSFQTPEYTSNVDGLGALRILESIRLLLLNKKTKFYQASTSELFGNTEIPQNEKTPFRPTSPYAIAKLYAYWTVQNYRKAYNIFAVNGILFNHEGPKEEVHLLHVKSQEQSQKGISTTKEFFSWKFECKRDWGNAKDYVESMWLMLQAKKPSDYVIATGKSYTVKNL